MRLPDPFGLRELRRQFEESGRELQAVRGELAASRSELSSLLQRTRRRSRLQYLSGRSYSAGGGHMDSLNADWKTYPFSVDEVIQKQLRILRARSREECRANPYGRRFKRLLATNIPGASGLTLQVKAQDPNGTPDKLASSAIEESWRLWGQTKCCDFERRLTHAQQQRVAVQTVGQDGEILILKMLEPLEVNPWRISYRMLDPELLDVDHREELRDGYIRMGIEFDNYHRRRAYWLWDSQSRGADPSTAFYSSGRRIRIPADQLIHLFVQEDPFQSRGIPWTATALYFLRQIRRLEEAALAAATLGAMQGGFFERDFSDESEEEDDETGQVVTPGVPIQDLSPDSPFQLAPAGMKFSAFTPQYPRGEFPGFRKTMLQAICAGCSVTYYGMSSDLADVNYSTAKVGRQDESDGWIELQDWLASDMEEVMHADWLRNQLLIGSLQVLGNPLNPDRMQKYLRHEWRGRTWPSPDPEKDANADEKDVMNGFRSAASVVRSRGGDPDEVVQECSDERKVRKEAGVPIPGTVPEPAASKIIAANGGTP